MPAIVRTATGIAIKIQLLRGTHYEPWPIEERAIEQRYSDAPPVTLRVPTLSSFAAWKTAARMDRCAARDLCDLWALCKVGGFNSESAATFAEHGPTSSPPRPWTFDRAPSAEEWRAQLAGQTRLKVSADEALEAVRAVGSRR